VRDVALDSSVWRKICQVLGISAGAQRHEDAHRVASKRSERCVHDRQIGLRDGADVHEHPRVSGLIEVRRRRCLRFPLAPSPQNSAAAFPRAWPASRDPQRDHRRPNWLPSPHSCVRLWVEARRGLRRARTKIRSRGSNQSRSAPPRATSSTSGKLGFHSRAQIGAWVGGTLWPQLQPGFASPDSAATPRTVVAIEKIGTPCAATSRPCRSSPTA